jgi:predicted dinucleotide-binding enzyme
MKVGVIGSGVVGQVLSDGFLKHGHEVVRGTREPAKLAAWVSAAGSRARAASTEECARAGELVVLAVKGAVAEEVVAACAGALDGKVVIDTTNPIADAPPQDGVLRFFTGLDGSLLERLQARAPRARFVKAFSCVGNALMVNPVLPGGPPTMFTCGNDPAAKATVAEVLRAFGWEVEDLGAAAAARAIEPLCILWCIPGFRQNRWQHALKLLERR